MPWLVGVVSSWADSLAAGLAALFVAAVILIALQLVRIRGHQLR